MSSAQWTVAEAKAKFSELMDRAKDEGPQVVTRNGKKAVIVVSLDEWERKNKPAGTLAEFFLNSPLRGSNLKIPRLKDKPRKIRL